MSVGMAQQSRESIVLRAEQGHAYAQFSLGAMHYEGVGVPVNLVEAHRLFRFAAQQGQADAQYNLGVMNLKAWASQ